MLVGGLALVAFPLSISAWHRGRQRPWDVIAWAAREGAAVSQLPSLRLTMPETMPASVSPATQPKISSPQLTRRTMDPRLQSWSRKTEAISSNVGRRNAGTHLGAEAAGGAEGVIGSQALASPRLITGKTRSSE